MHKITLRWKEISQARAQRWLLWTKW